MELSETTKLRVEGVALLAEYLHTQVAGKIGTGNTATAVTAHLLSDKATVDWLLGYRD